MDVGWCFIYSGFCAVWQREGMKKERERTSEHGMQVVWFILVCKSMLREVVWGSITPNVMRSANMDRLNNPFPVH